MTLQPPPPTLARIKCVIWDLDNTLWDGTLAEGDTVTLRPDALALVRLLDERGVLQSIASRNEREPTLERLRQLGWSEYFLHPQVGWHAKSLSVKAIADAFGFGLGTMAFIDDQAAERAEVQHAHPQVHCFDPADLSALRQYPPLTEAPTPEAKQRRAFYLRDEQRNTLEASFEGPKESFLRELELRMVVEPARREHLERAEELTRRTNQLNTTGYTYSVKDFEAMLDSPAHAVLVASLEDRFGPYGVIGLTVVERRAEAWVIKLLLMSCRVLSRGVGGVVIQLLRDAAQAAGARLFAEFKHTAVNRMMYATYRFAQFSCVERLPGEGELLECDLTRRQSFPEYVRVDASALYQALDMPVSGKVAGCFVT